MSLTGSLRIGNSALIASQLGLQTTGHNMANAATPGYSRQVADLASIPGQRSMQPVRTGSGVRIADIRRITDQAVLSRLHRATATEAAAGNQVQALERIETALNELTEFDLSSELTSFFSTWSERANLTQSSASVVQAGNKLAEFVRQLHDDLSTMRGDADRQLQSATQQADALLQRIAHLNGQIATAEAGQSRANDLRDHRDLALAELSQFVEISTFEQPTGTVDVLVDSVPVVMNSRSRGLELAQESTPTGVVNRLQVRDGQGVIADAGGAIGGLMSARGDAVDRTIDRLDHAVRQLIFQANRLHTTGTNPKGMTSVTSSLAVAEADRDRPLSDPTHALASGTLPSPRNGGFMINITNTTTGVSRSQRIDVDLDGINGAGEAGFLDDTTLVDIASAIDAVEGVRATLDVQGRLVVAAEQGFSFHFSDDSSDVLAAVGLGSFFEGDSARTISVRGELLQNPSQVVSGRFVDGTFVENGTALAIAQLGERTLDELGGESIRSHWLGTVAAVAVDAAGARTRSEAAGTVREALQNQRDAISGVNIDEAAIDMLAYQRQFQASARFISVVDELTQTLISIL